MQRLFKVSALTFIHFFCINAQAQDYPVRPIKLVVPYGPGGTPDIHARLFADQLRVSLKQPVVVENRVGGSGTIGAQAVANAPKDGYTLLWAASSLFGVNPFVYKKLPYSLEQFEPISNVAQVCFAFMVRPELGAKDLKGLTEYMKANPGKLNFANAGVGNQPHLIWERLLQATNTSATMIPYKSSPESFSALMGGFADTYVAVINSTDIQHVQSKKVLPLATTCSARVPQMPDVPTMTELGYKDFSVYGTYQLYAAKGVPDQVISKLATAVEEVKADKDYSSKLTQAVSFAAPEKTPGEFSKWLQADRQAWSSIAKKAGVVVE